MSDEIFYAAALHEYESGNVDVGLRAKAYVAADGAEHRVKIEYMKLRVRQLKDEGRKGSLRAWYSSTSRGERTVLVAISILLTFLFGLGLIPLGILIWLHAGEAREVAQQSR